MTDAGDSAEAELRRLVRAHDRWRGRSVFNLLPSENAVSPTARRYLASDLAGRYTLPMAADWKGERIDNSYTGTRYTDQIEALADRAAARLFRARHATVRPLSGHIAALSVLVPLVPPRSRVLAIAADEGGYDGYGPDYLPALLGHEARRLPATGPGHSVRAEEAVAAIRDERPQAVVLGQSFFLFPYPLRPIVEAAREAGALVLYDASHVLGLIAGGEFQDPLAEGVDVVYGSTHKSFPGPQGGLILTNREDLFARIAPALVWRVFDNAHWNRIAGVAQTLLELERVGREYARTTVASARRLAEALAARGWPLVAAEEGFTRSHQIHLDAEALRRQRGFGTATLARRLERQRLLIDLVGRIGTAEIARLGLTPEEMERLADLLDRGSRAPPRVTDEVAAWRSRYRSLRFQ
ncbi:MAG: serine hydroxymethyltransferase [Thermoplasmata archaeon]